MRYNSLIFLGLILSVLISGCIKLVEDAFPDETPVRIYIKNNLDYPVFFECEYFAFKEDDLKKEEIDKNYVAEGELKTIKGELGVKEYLEIGLTRTYCVSDHFIILNVYSDKEFKNIILEDKDKMKNLNFIDGKETFLIF